jgi:transcriptional regulator with XRE-family HTH domain
MSKKTDLKSLAKELSKEEARLLEPDHYDLGERLRFIREQRKLSQKVLAQSAGVSQATIAQVETGRKDPSVRTLRKIAEALDIDLATLFARDQVHVFDLPRMKRKYDHVDKLTPHLYTALGKVIRYAKEIGYF